MEDFLRISNINAPQSAPAGGIVEIEVSLVVTTSYPQIPVDAMVTITYLGYIVSGVGLVSPAETFQLYIPQMPDQSIVVAVGAYFWNSDAGTWTLDDTGEFTIASTAPEGNGGDGNGGEVAAPNALTAIMSIVMLMMVLGMMAPMLKSMSVETK